MTRLLLAATAAVLATVGACAERPVRGTDVQRFTPARTMQPFRSEQELATYYRELSARAFRGYQEATLTLDATMAPEPEPAAPAAASPEEPVSLERADGDESVTNVQHAGVDEGGIVKVHGDYLVMLRRGRLFTVRIGGNALAPVSAVDAFGPEMDPSNTWYDELLVSDTTVVVIGFSYQRGGTEVGLFHLGADGRLTYRSTYHMRSNDYYSSRNYASRLVGGKLVFYAPLTPASDSVVPGPAIRRWRPGVTENEFRSIVPATRVYRPARPLRGTYGIALHTVTICGLGGGEMDCDGTALIGPPGHVFYVSPGSVYLWATDVYVDSAGPSGESTLFRMPLDGGAPSAVAVAGSPIDQFSFLESGDGHLNVVVRAEGGGDGMWNAEGGGGAMSLLRVALRDFGDGSEAVPAARYRRLPRPAGDPIQNRFVGEYLLYGTGNGWGAPRDTAGSTLHAVRWKGGLPFAVALPHGVDRIEVMGSGAVVVGTDGRDLHFSAVRLDDGARLAGRYTRPGASQGELRSHGFFYRPQGEEQGLLGLPIRGAGRPRYEHLFHESASILFLRNERFQFQELGELAPRAEGTVDDGCRASCVDWYGNARPLFLRGRIFALLGYEIVEGTLEGGRIREARRVSYAPSSARAE